MTQPQALEDLAGSLRERLLREAGQEGEGDLHARIGALVERECGLLDADAREALVASVAERSFGLGPLEPLLRDPAVDEVMVNGPGTVWVERDGRLAPTDVRFASTAELRDAVERILAPVGRRVDEAQPVCAPGGGGAAGGGGSAGGGGGGARGRARGAARAAPTAGG